MTAITLRTPAIMGRTMFDQIFDQFFDDPRSMIKRSTDGYPLTDIYKNEDDSQVIEMALAGFSKENINIQIKENTITISSNTKSNTESKFGLARRIAKRKFSKTFVDYHNQLNFKETTANFENGLLRITIPQKDEIKPFEIQIK
jgi:HSP20 family molecular chaperone IbpA